RTQRIDLKALTDQEIAEALQQERGLSSNDAQRIAHAAAGSYTRALRQISVDHDERELLDLFILLMRKCYLRDIKEMKAWSELVASWGRERQKTFLIYAQRLVRENFVYNFRLPELNYMTEEESKFSTNFARFVNERNVIAISEELATAQRDIEQNVNPKMVFFDLALKMIVHLIQ
ncbi:MAG: DNA polymerase III subunit delta, partial [Bacteroidaceae bacterium]|nr:DNA polymerase III subunit delta [Bacteroidaceae bacterium]